MFNLSTFWYKKIISRASLFLSFKLQGLADKCFSWKNVCGRPTCWLPEFNRKLHFLSIMINQNFAPNYAPKDLGQPALSGPRGPPTYYKRTQFLLDSKKKEHNLSSGGISKASHQVQNDLKNKLQTGINLRMQVVSIPGKIN